MSDLDKLIRKESDAMYELKNAKKHLKDLEGHKKSVEFHWNSKHAEPGYDSYAERQQVRAAGDMVSDAKERVRRSDAAYESARKASSEYIKQHNLGR